MHVREMSPSSFAFFAATASAFSTVFCACCVTRPICCVNSESLAYDAASRLTELTLCSLTASMRKSRVATALSMFWLRTSDASHTVAMADRAAIGR